MQVLEAMLVTLILLGGAFAVIQFRLPSSPREHARASIEDVASDALVILDGLHDANGTVLEASLAEALHCEWDPAATSSCYGGRGRNLSFKLDSYLPEGAAYMIGLSNGAATHELWRDHAPMGEAIDTRVAIAPVWNLTFAITSLSCAQPGASLNATLVPILGGNLSKATSVKANLSNDVLVPADATPRYGLWNVTLPGATKPDAGTLRANTTAKGATFPGTAAYGSCALEGLTPTLQTALEAARLHVAGPSGAAIAPVTGVAAFTADLSALAAVPGATLLDRNVSIYAPLPMRTGEADGFARYAVVPLPSGAAPSATWTVPADSLYGAYPVVLRQKVQLTLPSTAVVELEARVVGILEVALPTGTVPVAPPYAAVLQVWFPDWR